MKSTAGLMWVTLQYHPSLPWGEQILMLSFQGLSWLDSHSQAASLTTAPTSSEQRNLHCQMAGKPTMRIYCSRRVYQHLQPGELIWFLHRVLQKFSLYPNVPLQYGNVSTYVRNASQYSLMRPLARTSSYSFVPPSMSFIGINSFRSVCASCKLF